MEAWTNKKEKKQKKISTDPTQKKKKKKKKEQSTSYGEIRTEKRKRSTNREKGKHGGSDSVVLWFFGPPYLFFALVLSSYNLHP